MWKQPVAYGALGLMLFIAASVIDTYARNVVVIFIGTFGLILFFSAVGPWLRSRMGSMLGPMTPFRASLLLWAFLLLCVFMLWQNWQDLSSGQTTWLQRRGIGPVITSLAHPGLFYGKISTVFLIFGILLLASIYGLVKVTRDSRTHGE